MWNRLFRNIAFMTVACWVVLQSANANLVAQDANAAAPVPFGEVKAVLRKHCGTCHNANEMRGGLDVMSEAAIQAGADSGSVIVPGVPEESLLYLVTTHEADPKMPPNSPKIPQRELSILRRWIAGMNTNASPATDKAPAESENSTASMNASSVADGSSLKNSSAAVPATSSSLAKITPLVSQAPVIASALHPDVAMIALAVNRQVVLLNKESREFAGAIDFPLGEVHALAYSSDGKQLVVGGGEPGASGGFILYDLNAKPLFQWNDEFDVIQTVAISPDHSMVAIGSPKRTVRVIGVKDGTEKFVIKKHTDWLTAVAFSPDGLLLASGDRFGGLYLWNAENGEEFANLKDHSGTVRGIQFSTASDHLISASEDGFLRRFDLQSLTLDKEWNCDIGGITAMAYGSPWVGDFKVLQAQPLAERFAAGRILVAGRNKKMKLYDFAGNPLWEETIPATVVPSLAMSADANNIFATTSTASVLCWLQDDHVRQPELSLPISAELNAQLLATISSQKPTLPEVADAKIAQSKEALPDMGQASDPANAKAAVDVASARTSSSSTLAESRKVLAETEDVLKRFSLITAQLESELEKQEMLRTRDLLRTRIASHRRLMQSLSEYLVDISENPELKDAATDAAAEQLAQQLKSTLEKDLSNLETKLAKLIESMTKLESMTEANPRK